MNNLSDEKSNVFSVVTQAYGPNGESLIDHEGNNFDGEPGIRLFVRQHLDGQILEGDVIISPFQNDKRKKSKVEFVPGKKLEVYTPKKHIPLPILPKLLTNTGAQFVAIYLTPELEKGEAIALANIWDDNSYELLTEEAWLAKLIEIDD